MQHGEFNNGVRLSRAQAQAVLDLWADGKFREPEIARLVGIKPSRVTAIVTGRNWAHLSPEHYEVTDRVMAAIAREFVALGLMNVSLGSMEVVFRELVQVVLERTMRMGLHPCGPKSSRRPGVMPANRRRTKPALRVVR